ncbi:MAG: hypothetical protein ACFE98_10180 [Candidatus Hermodarchaeota archaeon]
MKCYKIIFFSIVFLIFVVQFPLNSVVAEIQTSGNFYGFDWEYGLTTRNFSKSFSYTYDFSESETWTQPRTFTINAPIRTGLEITDVLWQRWINRSKAAPTNTWQPPGSPQNWLGYRADGLLTNKTDVGGAWYRYHGIQNLNWANWQQALNISWFGRQIDIGLAELPNQLATWKTSYLILTPISNVTVPMQDWLAVKHDSMNVSIYHIAYIYDNGTPGVYTDDIVVFQELLVPQFVLVRVLTTLYQVSVTETKSVGVSLSGTFNFSGTWEENLYGQHVSINDGMNYGFDYFALISGDVTFDASGGFSLQGYLSNNITRDVTFVDGGAPIPEAIRPIWLQSLRIRLAGNWDHSHAESGTLYGKGAVQSIIQVLLTKASTDQLPNLAAWGNFNPGRLIGYKDVDGDGILTAFLNESQIATSDAIMAIGFPEGAYLEGEYNGKVIANADVYMSLGDWIIADNESTATMIVDKSVSETWGYDPRNSETGPSDVSLVWKEPLESDGIATFEWETTYSDTPVTWWAKNDSTVLITQDLADITYGYSLSINPEVGEAKLDTTYSQSAIQDVALKSMIESQSISMATYHRDYYLSMTQTSADTSGAFSRLESQFTTTVSGEDLFSQDFGGKKESYYLHNSPSTKYEAGTSVMNLLTAEGFSGEPTNRTERNPFSSPISKRIAAALTQWSADNQEPGVSWIFRENIVITSYPTWNGEGITHDPTYSAFYAGTGARVAETTETSGASELPESTPEEGVPGFGLGFSMVVLSTITLLIKKQKPR